MSNLPNPVIETSNESHLDIASNRRAIKYSRNEMLFRIIWAIIQPIFRYSPRPCFGWRNFILRCMGAKVGKNVHIYPSVKIYYPWMFEIGDWSSIGEETLIYNLGRTTIGSQTTISHRSHLCAGTHDYRLASLPLLRPPIMVGNQVWICSGAFVGPNTHIAEGAIVGACAVVTKDVSAWEIVAGNPARTIKIRKIIPETSANSTL